MTTARRVIIPCFTLLFLCLNAEQSFGQITGGKWDDIMGKQILNLQGVQLGHVTDNAIDIENARFVGVMVSFGGFMGIGEKTVIIPPGALTTGELPRTLYLDMDAQRFRNAPSFKMSKTVGPPFAVKVAETYRYFGQQPYFTTVIESSPHSSQKLEQLGYIQRDTKIRFLPVVNLQGVNLGHVVGLRGLSLSTGGIEGVVIGPSNAGLTRNLKIVPAQALRYDLSHDSLRLNDHLEAFKDSADFTISSNDHFTEEPDMRPGIPKLPLVQDNSPRDKAITEAITKKLLWNTSLSHYAKNIQIGTVHGKTIVRGRVQTLSEKNQIMAYATGGAGRGNVTDLLEIQTMSNWESNIDR